MTFTTEEARRIISETNLLSPNVDKGSMIYYREGLGSNSICYSWDGKMNVRNRIINENPLAKYPKYEPKPLDYY